MNLLQVHHLGVELLLLQCIPQFPDSWLNRSWVERFMMEVIFWVWSPLNIDYICEKNDCLVFKMWDPQKVRESKMRSLNKIHFCLLRTILTHPIFGTLFIFSRETVKNHQGLGCWLASNTVKMTHWTQETFLPGSFHINKLIKQIMKSWLIINRENH